MLRWAPVLAGEATISEVDKMSVPDLFDLLEIMDIKNALKSEAAETK
jgi:hypothetical protein